MQLSILCIWSDSLYKKNYINHLFISFSRKKNHQNQWNLEVWIHRLNIVSYVCIHYSLGTYPITMYIIINKNQASKQTNTQSKFITLANKSHLENQSKWVYCLIPSFLSFFLLFILSRCAYNCMVSKKKSKLLISVSKFYPNSSVNYTICVFPLPINL